MAIIISDTSPIRALSHLGLLELLHVLFGEVLIPPAVLAELEQPRSKLPQLAIQGLSFIHIQAPDDISAVNELALSMDRGEAEALVLATELHADAVLIDEEAGRAIAQQRGLVTIGALGLLVRPKGAAW